VRIEQSILDHSSEPKFNEKISVSVLRLTIALIGLALCASAIADPRTVNDGVFTKAQAKVGEQLYAEHCMLCHDKKYFRPVLKRWESQPLGILFAVMSTSMPETNPGFLNEKEYVDILAYILSLSRYAPGDTELDFKDGALNEVTVAPRQRKQ
jgi:mono/diheme cytochrome c family protein